MVKKLSITLITFGFKYGIPRCNFYFDVSFFKNPAREEGKTLFSEIDDEMVKLLQSDVILEDFIESICRVILIASQRDKIVCGIGCNSGRHRSRIIAEMIRERVINSGFRCEVIHQD